MGEWNIMGSYLQKAKVIFCDIDGTLLRDDAYLFEDDDKLDIYDPECTYELHGVHEKISE